MPSAAMTSAMQLLRLGEPLGGPVLERLGAGLRGDPRSRRRRTSRAGRCDVSGSPPASEITSGRAVTAIRSRMAEDVMTRVREANSPA